MYYYLLALWYSSWFEDYVHGHWNTVKLPWKQCNTFCIDAIQPSEQLYKCLITLGPSSPPCTVLLSQRQGFFVSITKPVIVASTANIKQSVSGSHFDSFHCLCGSFVTHCWQCHYLSWLEDTPIQCVATYVRTYAEWHDQQGMTEREDCGARVPVIQQRRKELQKNWRGHHCQ